MVVQLLICVRLFATPWTAVCQAPLSFTISPSLLELMSIESVMQSNHLVLCRPFLLLPSIRTFFFFLAALHGLWDLSSLTRDRTHVLGSEYRILTTGLPVEVLILTIFRCTVHWR